MHPNEPPDLSSMTEEELASYIEKADDEDSDRVQHADSKRFPSRSTLRRAQRVQDELFRRATTPATGKRIPIHRIGGAPLTASLRNHPEAKISVRPRQSSGQGERGDESSEQIAQERSKAAEEARAGHPYP
jgi:vacuolar-type H+-ATPase subunit H